ncbi:MAG TPA: hypothetical protein DIW43_02030 [Spongiibacteraceae bacterium]|nr:hypothetical protein [Spongiibacteraceae bacterium]HCS26200.1 hypothetical protein [Spongiibacteraceae bacterium]|tara:strand:+ start:1542 stop:2456 length:915 start_codon:yes stop_codon:yes gene_type:complete
MRTKSKTITLTLAAIFLAGCAGFRGGNLPNLMDADLALTEKTKTRIFYENQFDTSMNISDKSHKKALEKQKQQFFEQLSRSGCCELVETRDEADLIVNAKLALHSSNAAMIGAFITGYSLYTIPSWVTPKMTYEVDVVSSAGVAHSYRYQDQYTLVQWLPMLFVFPFANPLPMEKELQFNAYRNLLVDLKKSGLLKAEDSTRLSRDRHDEVVPAKEAPPRSYRPQEPRTSMQPARSEPSRVPEQRSAVAPDTTTEAKRVASAHNCSTQIELDYQGAGGSIYMTPCGARGIKKIMCDQTECRLMD